MYFIKKKTKFDLNNSSIDYEKTLNFTSRRGNVNQNHSERPPHTNTKSQKVSVGEDAGLGASYVVTETTQWCSL